MFRAHYIRQPLVRLAGLIVFCGAVLTLLPLKLEQLRPLAAATLIIAWFVATREERRESVLLLLPFLLGLAIAFGGMVLWSEIHLPLRPAVVVLGCGWLATMTAAGLPVVFRQRR